MIDVAGDLKEFDVEISSWAYITHTPARLDGGIYTAHDRQTDAEAGRLSYFRLDQETLMFKDISVHEDYRRRRVATALLRCMYLDHPESRINPGTRNAAGEEFYRHILGIEPDLVASHGVLNVPLRAMMPPGFGPQHIPTGGGLVY